MEIQSILIRVADPQKHNPALRAFASVIVGGAGLALRVDGIRVIRRASGRIAVAWPNRIVHGLPQDERARVYLDDDRQPYWHRDEVYPADAASAARFERAILRAYDHADRNGLTDYVERLADVTPRVAAIAG